MVKYSVVIPCYNEEENLYSLAQRISEVIKRDDVQIVLVDNGSKDNSEIILKELQEKYKFIKLAKVDVNQGYGFGIMNGLKVADGEYIGWIHADMQLEPSNINKVIKCIESHNDANNLFIKGKRLNRPFIDKFFTWGMGLFETMLFGKKMVEVCSIPVMFHRSMLESMTDAPDDFSIEIYTYAIAHKLGKKVIHIPVELKAREKGNSSWNNGLISRIKLSIKMIKSSLKIRKIM